MHILLVGFAKDWLVEASQRMSDLGWQVASARDPQEAVHRHRERSWDVIVMDTKQPAADALSLCRVTRGEGRYTPLILLSERGEEVHRIVGLELGADDYLVKPVSLAEMLARIKAITRAARHRLAEQAGEVLAMPGLQIDTVGRRVRIAGRSMHLTPREFDLLAELARHPGDVLSCRRLLGRVWRDAGAAGEHTLVSHVHRLRAKLHAQDMLFIKIVTVWGRGYRLMVEAPPA